jgi:hypothetical protein
MRVMERGRSGEARDALVGVVHPTVSRHEVAVFRALQISGWTSSKQVAEVAGVSGRTARGHLWRFVRLGISEEMALFPEHLHRLRTDAAKSNPEYHRRMMLAMKTYIERRKGV